MRTETMITVRDVRKSSAFYCQLFGAEHDHDSDEFDRILRRGKLLLMLHHLDAHEHGMALVDSDQERMGNGVVIWFLVEDLDLIYGRAKDMGVEIVVEPHENPLARWREFTFKDLDGYTVAVAETGWE